MTAIANLVWETTTSTGTGNLTLVQVAQRFSTAFGTGSTEDVGYYFIFNQDVAGEYEWGTGHTSDADTLVRDTVLGGSNGTSAVDFSAGTKHVTNALPASKQAPFGLIGMIVPWAFSSEPDWGAFLDGAALNRADYPTLWTLVQTSGNLAATEGAKLDGQFGPGNGSTTFTLPDLETSQRIIRPWNGTGIGAEENDALPNILAGNFQGTSAAGNGAIAGTDSGGDYDPVGPGARMNYVFDASNSNAIYGAAAEVRMKSVHLPYILVTGGVGA